MSRFENEYLSPHLKVTAGRPVVGSFPGMDTGGMQGVHTPNQTWTGADMTVDFTENDRQKYFCSVHYLVAKDANN